MGRRAVLVLPAVVLLILPISLSVTWVAEVVVNGVWDAKARSPRYLSHLFSEPFGFGCLTCPLSNLSSRAILFCICCGTGVDFSKLEGICLVELVYC